MKLLTRFKNGWCTRLVLGEVGGGPGEEMAQSVGSRTPTGTDEPRGPWV